MSPAPVCQERWLDGVETLAGDTSSSAPWPPILVCTLLQDAERARLGLANFAAQVRIRPRIELHELAIRDRDVPRLEALTALVRIMHAQCTHPGGIAIVHCHGGIGRSGLVAGCLLRTCGMSPTAAIEAVTTARGIASPETPQQRAMIAAFAPLDDHAPPV